MREPNSRRVTLVTNELRGLLPVGGMGTATTFLALALARMGHSVEVLLAWQSASSIDPYWGSLYKRAGVHVRSAPQSDERVDSWHFGVMRSVELALRADPPDVVIAHDLDAPAYSALRLRQAGVAFDNSLFVVFCHGTKRWILDMSRKVGAKDPRGSLAVAGLERASVELADVVVSPSAYLVGWMRDQGWRLPQQTLVIPYFTRSGATGEGTPEPARAEAGDHVNRLVFFGRFEEKKGLRSFVTALNALEPDLLEGLELEFLGKATATWTRERVEGLLSETTTRRLRGVSFETQLDQPEALARLSRPGTLAVMPSFGDNSPNTVYECLERGIPFIAGDAGGIPELIAPADRSRVLFEPTADGTEAALRRVLAGENDLRPALPAFDSAVSNERWAKVIAMRPHPRPHVVDGRVDVIVVSRSSRKPLSGCLSALERQSYTDLGVIVSDGASVEAARAAGLQAGSAPYVVFLDEEDALESDLVETLVRAQRATGADVVSCALRLTGDHNERTLHFFSGEPGGLGVLANDYGNVALFRRSLFEDQTRDRPAEGDPDWPLLARLSVSGARIVSVPVPLVTRRARPGTIERHPGDALLVLQHFESGLPAPVRSMALLAAGVAATPPPRATDRALRHERLSEVARRALRRLFRGRRST
jgi:glycosyltransferase involved in cell wall biosynthesis